MWALLLLLPLSLLVGCQPPRATDPPDPAIPRVDVSMYDLARPQDWWTGIVVAPTLLLTVAHSDIPSAEVVVIDSHATYVQQIVGSAADGYIDVMGEVESDWLLVSTAGRVDETVAVILFNSSPVPGTRVRLVGRSRVGLPDGPLLRCCVEGTVIGRPLFVPDTKDAIYVKTERVDGHGFSGGPMLLADGPDAGAVVGMISEGYQSLIGLPGTIFVARRIEESMVVPTIEGKRFRALGRRRPFGTD